MEYIIDLQKEELMDIERLVSAYGDSVLRMCVLYLKDRALAEDAVQETFIKVYQKYHTFKHEAGEKTWIMKIAINTCKNYRRTCWFQKVITGVDLETISEESIEGKMIQGEDEKRLFDEVMGLSIKYKEVILLYYYQELSTKEIAEVLGLKEGTVRVRLQRAREKLSVQLREVGMYE
ncbi:MAG: sigma-70 family RNA polymerase sigma factor [Cellulosilyticaceae bacterium]